MYSSSRLISASISTAGRCQFSWLKANRRQHAHAGVEAALDHLAHRAPCRRGGRAGAAAPRPLAQRPLPSMMIAMWAGHRPWTCSRWSRSSLIRHTSMISASLDVDQAVDLLDVLVGELLDVLLGPRLVVLGDLLELLDLRHRLGARVPHGDAAFLGQLVHHLHQLLAALLGQRRQRHPDQVALRGRVEAEVGVADGLLDGLGQALVERLHGEQPRLGRGHHGHLVERHVRCRRPRPARCRAARCSPCRSGCR